MAPALALAVHKPSPCAAGTPDGTPPTAGVGSAAASDPRADLAVEDSGTGERSKLTVGVEVDRLKAVTVVTDDASSSASCDVSVTGAADGVKSGRSSERHATRMTLATPTVALCTVTVARGAVMASPERLDSPERASVVGDGRADAQSYQSDEKPLISSHSWLQSTLKNLRRMTTYLKSRI